MGLVLLTALALAIVTFAADVLLVIFGGVLLGVFFRGSANLLNDRTRLSPKMALGIVFLLFFGGAILAIWLIAGEVSQQLDQLGTNLKNAWLQLQERLRSEPWGRQLLGSVRVGQSGGEDAEAMSPLARAFSTTLGGLTNLLIILFLGIYFAINPGWYRRGLLRLIPPAQRDRAAEILDAIGHTLRWWLLGRAISMLIVGIVTGVGLALLGVPLALGLGFLAGAFDFVPFIGPLAAAAPGILLSVSEGVNQAMYVAAFYAAVQLIEGYLLTPLVEQRSVKLPPALTIGSQVLLGVLVGALGVVFATPLLAVLVIIVKKLYVEEALEHRSTSASDGVP